MFCEQKTLFRLALLITLVYQSDPRLCPGFVKISNVATLKLTANDNDIGLHWSDPLLTHVATKSHILNVYIYTLINIFRHLCICVFVSLCICTHSEVGFRTLQHIPYNLDPCNFPLFVFYISVENIYQFNEQKIEAILGRYIQHTAY